LTAIYAYVRTSLDSDAIELPDALLGVWENMAEYRIWEAIEETSNFETSETLSTSASDARIIPVAVTGRIEVVNGPFWQLRPIPHENALLRWPLNRLPTAAGRVTGEPTHWSDDDLGNIWLWPAPSAVETMVINGYKTFTATDTTTLSNTPALPAAVHPLIGEYLVAKGAEMQQNAQIASMKMARFEGELDIQVRRLGRPSKARQSTLGGARSRINVEPSGRLRYPWE
jgi:hypothetical protein